MLSDADIRRELLIGGLTIDPAPTDSQMQPCSIDLRLGAGFLKYRPGRGEVPISNIPDGLTYSSDYPHSGLALYPGEFLLATTAERVTLSDYLVGRLEGKSTIGRLGLAVHTTAGLIDPGFDGHITLEVSNIGPLTLRLRPGDLIGQLTLDYLTTACERPYGSDGLASHYQGQTAATGPRSGR